MNPSITRAADDGAITFKIVTTPSAPPDEIRPIAALADEWGLEQKGLERAIQRAAIATVKIGRQMCVRRSDVLALVDKLATKRAEPKANAASAYAALVAASGRRGRQ